MPDMARPLTAYEILRVQPSAPANLIVACYWDLAKDIRTRHESDADIQLHALSRAFEAVSDPERKAAYDAALGIEPKPLIRQPLPRKRFFLARLFRPGAQGWNMDPHEVLGLQPDALQCSIPEAYRLARNAYLRLPPGRRRDTLLGMVEDAYAVIGDPERRIRLLQSNGNANEPLIPQPAKVERPAKQPTAKAPVQEKRPAPVSRDHHSPPPAPDLRPEVASHQAPPEPLAPREAPRQTEPAKPARPISREATVNVNPTQAPRPAANTRPSAAAPEQPAPGLAQRLAPAWKLAGVIARAIAAALWWLLLTLGRMTARVLSKAREVLKQWWAARVEARHRVERESATDDMFLGRLASTVNDTQSKQSATATKTQVGPDER